MPYQGANDTGANQIVAKRILLKVAVYIRELG